MASIPNAARNGSNPQSNTNDECVSIMSFAMQCIFFTVHVFPPSRDQPRLWVFWPNFLRRVLFLDNRPGTYAFMWIFWPTIQRVRFPLEVHHLATILKFFLIVAAPWHFCLPLIWYGTRNSCHMDLVAIAQGLTKVFLLISELFALLCNLACHIWAHLHCALFAGDVSLHWSNFVVGCRPSYEWGSCRLED